MTHAYFDALSARPDTWKAYSLRDGDWDNTWCKYDATVDALRVVIPAFYWKNSTTAAMDATTDILPVDTDSTATHPKDMALRIDAEIVVVLSRLSATQMRVKRAQYNTAAASHASGAGVYNATNSLRSQVRLPLETTDGHSWVCIWDVIWGRSYLNAGPFNHKAFQFTSGNDDQIWLEPGSSYKPPTDPAWDPARHVSKIHTRSYHTPEVIGPADWMQSDGNKVGPGTTWNGDDIGPSTGFWTVVDTVTRYYCRIDQRGQDYDPVDLYVADETRDPVHVLRGPIVSVRKSGNKPNTSWRFWLEFNSSDDTLYRTDYRDLVCYVRNVWMGKDVADFESLLIRPEAGVPVPPEPPIDPIPPEPPEMNMVVNPSAVEFVSPDHADATAYKLECLDEAKVVKKTINVSLAECTIVNGKIHIAVNVQQLKPFGLYTTRSILVAGAVQSAPSGESAVWERAPGPPSDVVML